MKGVKTKKTVQLYQQFYNPQKEAFYSSFVLQSRAKQTSGLKVTTLFIVRPVSMAPLQKDHSPHPVPSRNGAHKPLASPCVGINPEDKCKLFWFATTGSNLSSYRRVLPSVRANGKGYPRVVLLRLPLAQLQQINYILSFHSITVAQHPMRGPEHNMP